MRLDVDAVDRNARGRRRHARRREAVENVVDEPHPEDVGIFPLGIPLIAGPGAITSALLLTSRHKGEMVEQGIVLAAILAVLLITLITFLAADRLGRFIGPTIVAIEVPCALSSVKISSC